MPETTSPYALRPLQKSDEALLRDMLYLGLYVPEGAKPFPKSIVDKPELARYYQNWGRPLDLGFVAMLEEERVGIISCRLFTAANKGYGYIDGSTPEMSIAILPLHRRKGLGTRLMERLFTELRNHSVKAVSLSVDAENQAVHLYRRMGFEKVSFDGNAHTLRKSLDQRARSKYEVLAHFLKRPAMYIQPVDKTTTVAFITGLEAVTDSDWQLSKRLALHLDLERHIPQNALGWPNQVQRYAERNGQEWWTAFAELALELLEERSV